MQGVTRETLPLVVAQPSPYQQKQGGLPLKFNGGGGSNLYDPNHLLSMRVEQNVLVELAV